jgi:hypothetical protein
MPVAPVAGFSGDQQQAFQLFRDAQGSGQPYINQAFGAYDASRAPITAQDVNQYYNPMVDSVTANLKDIFGQQNRQNQGDLTSKAGGVGADRIAVGMANLGKEQGLAAGQTYSQLYQQALQQAQQQKQMQAAAAQGFAGLGNQTFSQNLQGAGALLGAGQTQQQQSQAELNAPYQNTLARLAYPFQTAQYLAGITGGLAPAFGGTTTGQSQTTKPAPTLLSQIFGGLTAGAGLLGSTGGFGKGSSPAYGGDGSFGSGNGVWGGSSANPLPGLSPSDYGLGFAEGGSVDEEDVSMDPIKPGHSIVPEIKINPGAGHSGPLTGGMQFPQASEDKGSSSSGGLGDLIGAAAKVVPFFLKRGGTIPGYDDGGATFDDRFGGFPVTQAEPPGEVNQYLTPHEQAIDAFRMASTKPTRLYGKTNPDDVELPTEAEPTIGNMRSRPNDPVKEYMAPQDQMPYPGATERNWGQDAARSPWMSLVKAGAAMMSTPGNFGQSLGAGLAAGAKSVDEQRKELRSEEEINNKARTLYQSAKQHLDQYTKMTPYQREALRLRNKEIDQEENKKTGATADFKPAEITAAIKAVKDDPMNIGKSPEELKALVAQQLAMRKALRSSGDVGAPAADGSTSSTALPDPGAGGRIKGKWYIGPSGQPQQWLG